MFISNNLKCDSNTNIVAIVQARMGSIRLPGKVLMNIVGKPMLWHVINRFKYSKLINEIIVATSTNKKDDLIEEFCKKYDIDSYRGSENDVLDRYCQAAKNFNADIVVRITSDCPLIDPKVVDKVIKSYLDKMKDFDGATTSIRRTYPRGLDTEVFSFEALKKCWEGADNEYQREHVTVYMYENPASFRLYNQENNKDLSHLRWTVDEKADLKFVRKIYKKLYQKGRIFLMNDVLDLLEKEPFLEQINRHVEQKEIIIK